MVRSMTIKPFLEIIDWIWGKKGSKTDPRKILIVEDDRNDVELLQLCLHKCGYGSTVADTAEAARVLIDRNHISVIFVDLRLTFMKGWELIPLIWRKSPNTLVIVLASNVSDLMKMQSKAGFFVYIQKPPSVEMIRQLFARLKL